MKDFIIDVDFTMSKRFYVQADNEEQAKSIFERIIKKNPYDVARGFDALVGHKIVDVNEEDLL